MNVKLEGIICALLTPLTAEENIDREATGRLVDHVVSGGIRLVIALGSTGEQANLREREKQIFLEAVRQALPDKIPLIAGVGDTGTQRTIDNCRVAQDAGADALIVTPPSYYIFDDKALLEYYRKIADETKLPLILYNISRYTGNKLSADLVRQLCDHPRIIGIKDSDRDMDCFREFLRITQGRDDFAVIQGSDRVLLESFVAGSSAGVSVTANICPSLTVKLFENFARGDLTSAQNFQDKNLDLVKIIIRHGCFPVELKTAAAGMGLCSAAATSPFFALSAADAQNIVKDVNQLIERI